MLHFWFERGVDGFRLDALHAVNGDTPPFRIIRSIRISLSIAKDQQPFFRQLLDAAQLNQPSIQNFHAIRAVCDGYDIDS